VEEAAEVFEAHVVSALSKDCEHLILIGDHNQLRPNPAVYKLVTDYNLDISLFERLVMNNTKKVMLTCQHRMRPEISVLMKHFYEQKIADAKSVLSFGNVLGLDKNIFFFNHSHLENRLNESKSKANFFESKFLVKLCQFLLRQSYAQTQITVLTMYLGQMTEVKNRLRALELTEIKVTTVDNYQGEENDFVLLSLVRSNTYGSIGFLEVNNRVCVALSRARKGKVSQLKLSS
jgi:superfamily I DNA and/or RNA helicase